MWSKVIDALIGEVKRRREPKARLASALKALQDALVDCHEAFLRYRGHPSYDVVREYHYHRPPTDYYELQKKHRNAVHTLIRRAWDLRNVLPIFAPEVMHELQRYTLSEIERWAPSDLLTQFWDDYHGPNRDRFHRLQHLLSGYEYTPPLAPPTDEELSDDFYRFGKLTAWAWGTSNQEAVSPTYDAATKKLREFMAEYFTPEELY